jgi:hypothetical protein
MDCGPFYEKRRAVKRVRLQYVRNSLPSLQAVFLFVSSWHMLTVTSVRRLFFQEFTPLFSGPSWFSSPRGPTIIITYVLILILVTRLLPSRGRLRLGLIQDTISPSPRLSSAFFRGVPFGLVVHPSMAVSTHHSGTSSDDGVGTWRPVLRESGPSPARMGPPRYATWIHSTFRNLSRFDPAQFSGLRLSRAPTHRRRIPLPP